MTREQYFKYSHLWEIVANKIALWENWNEQTDWNEHIYVLIDTIDYQSDKIDAVLVFADGTIEFHEETEGDAYNWTDYPVEVIENVLKEVEKNLPKYK